MTTTHKAIHSVSKTTTFFHSSYIWFAGAILTAGIFIILPEDFFSRLQLDLCLFKLLFDHPCPGCGTLRGLSHFFHGHFLAAWQSNPFVYFWLVATPVYFLWRHFYHASHSTIN